MKKKIIFSLIAVVAVVGAVAGMSAYEAHVINVTAHIENALSVSHDQIIFGTVFPQEKLFENITIALSSSFLEEDRVDDVDYFIRQKPKPRPEFEEQAGVAEARHWCYENFGEIDEETYFANCYYNLCPYLSKHSEDENDGDLDAFHEMGMDVYGHLAKSEQDFEDIWTIDLDVPCFQGMCAQDWTHHGWELPADLEHEVFGCDLWIEVTNISLPGETPQICEEKPDVMLTLDRSGSISSLEMDTLKIAAKAFVDAMAPSSDGVHMGEVSFSDTATLDQILTDDGGAVKTAIDALSSGGLTNLEDAIQDTDAELGGANDRDDNESPDFIVLITDGAPTTSNTGGDHAANAAAAAAVAKGKGITIYVVGVGTTGSTTDYLKNQIATSPAHYFDASDWSQLEAALAGLVCPAPEELACKNSGGTVGTQMCLCDAGDFPDMCGIGACTCTPGGPEYEIKVCNCEPGYCFDGTTCVDGPF